MEQDQSRYGAGYWNLDGLELRDNIKGRGDVQEVSLKQNYGPANRIALRYGATPDRNRIIVLGDRGRAVYITDLKGEQVDTICRSPHENSLDVSVFSGTVYVLDRHRGRITEFVEGLTEFHEYKSWAFDSYHLASARFVLSSHGEKGVWAYIGPCDGNRIIRANLDTQADIREIEIEIPAEPKTLGHKVNFCIDNKNGTFVIADTMHHRVIEADCETGEATVLCGTGQPGRSNEGETGGRAMLNSPKAVAIYRPKDVIDRAVLNNRSHILLDLDRDPRMILIADSGNFCVKKLLDFSIVATSISPNLVDRSLYTLIGSGTERNKRLSKTWKRSKRDLREYSIPEPLDLTVSRLGELFIGCGPEPIIILLRPATARAEAISQQKASSYHLDET